MGLKTWEIRSQNALKRGTIYIAISGLSEIWGEVTLTDSHKPSATEWNHSSLKHRIAHRSDPSSPHPPFATQPWAWHFTCARLYKSPVLASRPKGPVVWTTFTPVLSDSGPSMVAATPVHELPPPPPTSPPDVNTDGTDTVPRGPTPPRTDNTAPTDPRTPAAASPDPRGPTTLPPVPPVRTDARARASMAILLQHQDQVWTAMNPASHSAQSIRNATSLVESLANNRDTQHSPYPYQQDEVLAAVYRRSHNARRNRARARARNPTAPSQPSPTSPHTSPADDMGEWSTMLTAKYLGLSDPHGATIANGVHIAHVGRRHRTTTNSDISSELGWLSQVSNQSSPHHNKTLAEVWRALTHQGLDPDARLPAIYKAPSEVSAAIAAYTRHRGADDHNSARAEARAAVAALQSSGHLMTEPLPTHDSDRALASTLGLPSGTLTLPQLSADWAYHARTAPIPVGDVPPDSDTSSWLPSLVGTLENPTRSSLFRAVPLDTRPPPPAGKPERPQSSVRNWNLRSITRGTPFAHCSGGAAWEKEAYIPSNWAICGRMCNGHSGAHNCGHGRKHPISGGGKHSSANAVPSALHSSWSHTIPAPLYYTILASSGHMSSPSLHGHCAVHVGSGTASMRRALALTGLFVIGIDIEPIVHAGTRQERTTFVADYDAHEDRFGALVETSIHVMGFHRSDTILIGFDADCKTRSQMTMNMNGKCRDGTTGRVDPSKPGSEEALKRDRIDRKAVAWMDSILLPHSDTECITHALSWPHGPGGWGFSEEDAHTLLISPPRWEPTNITVRDSNRQRARNAYRRLNRTPRPPPALPTRALPNGVPLRPDLILDSSPPPSPKAPGHAGMAPP